MKHLLSTIIYVGIGCAYQSTYDDVSIRQIALADVPVSTFGHIFAWPFVILYHLLGLLGWGILGLIAIGCLVLLCLVFNDWRARRERGRRIAQRGVQSRAI